MHGSDFGGRIWIDETAQAFDEGVASDLVVDRLVAAPRLVRAGVRWRRTVAAAFAVLGALALAASWFAWSQYWAERQARSGLLAAKSQLDRDNDPTLALLLAAESWRTLPTPAARSALAAALATHPRLGATLDRVVAPDGRELDVSELRFAPDGTRLFALAGDARASSVLVGWDLATGRRLPLALPEGLRPAGFVEHPQGQVVVTLARPGDPATAMQMWSVETGRAIGAMIEPLPEALVPQLLMPDGQHVALAGRGPPQVQVRTLDGRVVLERLADQKLSRTRLLLSHDGRFVHGLTLGMQLHRWQAADWAPARASIDVSAVHQNLHDGFAASPDGRWLAFGDTENRPLLWDLKRDAPAPWTYPGHTGHLASFAFGPDSRVMASASWDGTVRLWNVGNVEVHFDPRPLAVHKGIVRDVVFNPSPGPRRLATAGQDGRVLLWDIDAAPPLARRISDPDEKTVGALAFSRDGTRLFAARGPDLEAWTLDPPRRVWRVTAHGSDIDRIALLTDGRSVVTYASYPRELKPGRSRTAAPPSSAKVETPEGLGSLVLAPATGEIVVRTADALYAYGADALHLNVEVQPPDGTRFSELAAGPGDDEVMAGTQDGQILVYGPGLQLRARLPGQGDMPLALAGNVRSGVVAAVIRGRNDSVVLWPRGRPAIDGAPLRVEGRQHATVSELAISADGQTLFGSGIGSWRSGIWRRGRRWASRCPVTPAAPGRSPRADRCHSWPPAARTGRSSSGTSTPGSGRWTPVAWPTAT